MTRVGFTKSRVDECIFYKNRIIYILYTDDSILACPDKKEIEEIMRQIENADLNITEEGDIRDFLGVNIKTNENGKIELTQPHLVDQILSDIKMDQDEVMVKDILAMISNIFCTDSTGTDFNKSFHH